MQKDLTSGVVCLQKISNEKLTLAKEFRSKPTETEKLLWQKLRAKRCGGLKFRRQQIIEGFIVDFYCESKKLVVEIDGKIHEKQVTYDEHRTKVFNARGLRVMRVSNAEILENIEKVLEKIASY